MTAGDTEEIQQETQTATSESFLARYELLEEINSGGMGIVYRARHRSLEKLVAVKRMKKGQSAERFFREARILAQIRSPYVVGVHDFEVMADGTPFLVMDWIDGEDLESKIKRSGIPDESIVHTWMKQVCEAMATTAEQGIIHRDLKPSNILIDRANCALVADFGLARSTHEISSTGIVGTARYMAPEQVEDPRSVDTRTDIYSFGATFYHVLTGVPPFVADNPIAVLFKHKVEPLVSPRFHNPKLSVQICRVLERCLAKSPKDRFQTFFDVATHLRQSCDEYDAADKKDEGLDGPALAQVAKQYRSQRAKYLSQRQTFSDTYHFANGNTLQILSGDIVSQPVEAIVSSDDSSLSMGGGVSAAIWKAAGREFELEAQRFTPVRHGRVVVTSAGRLAARFVFHGVTIDFTQPAAFPSLNIISEILAGCFYHADTLYVKTIAFPLLGAGVGTFPRDVCLDTMVACLASRLLEGMTSVEEARIILAGPVETLEYFAKD